jgi:hypothetical protein
MTDPTIKPISTWMATYEAYSHKASEFKKGTLRIVREGALILRDFYTIGGIMSLAKALSTDLHILSLIPTIGGLFDQAKAAFSNYKAVHYASGLFLILPGFVNKDRTGFQLPRVKDGLDYLKLCFAIGGVLDLESYLHKHEVCPSPPFTPLITSIARRCGIEHVPIVCRLSSTPKEFFFLLGSCIDTWRWCCDVYAPKGNTPEERAKYRRDQFSFENLLRVTMCSGRALTFMCYRQYGKEWWFYLLQIVLQNGAPIRHGLAARRMREEKRISEGMEISQAAQVSI